MQAFYNELFDYNFHCNKKLIVGCTALPELPPRTVSLFSHILNAHDIWNSRILGNESPYEVWQEHPISQWEDIHHQNQRNTWEIVRDTPDFGKTVNYTNNKGERFSNSVGDILFHIINHSTHHRGQIASSFRASGNTPDAMDYIFYKR